MNENELKKLIEHTLLLPRDIKEKLLCLPMEGPLQERLVAFFSEYHPIESAIISDLEPEIIRARKVLQNHLEQKDALDSKRTIEQELSSFII